MCCYPAPRILTTGALPRTHPKTQSAEDCRASERALCRFRRRSTTTCETGPLASYIDHREGACVVPSGLRALLLSILFLARLTSIRLALLQGVPHQLALLLHIIPQHIRGRVGAQCMSACVRYAPSAAACCLSRSVGNTTTGSFQLIHHDCALSSHIYMFMSLHRTMMSADQVSAAAHPSRPESHQVGRVWSCCRRCHRHLLCAFGRCASSLGSSNVLISVLPSTHPLLKITSRTRVLEKEYEPVRSDGPLMRSQSAPSPAPSALGTVTRCC